MKVEMRSVPNSCCIQLASKDSQAHYQSLALPSFPARNSQHMHNNFTHRVTISTNVRRPAPGAEQLMKRKPRARAALTPRPTISADVLYGEIGVPFIQHEDILVDYDLVLGRPQCRTHWLNKTPLLSLSQSLRRFAYRTSSRHKTFDIIFSPQY